MVTSIYTDCAHCGTTSTRSRRASAIAPGPTSPPRRHQPARHLVRMRGSHTFHHDDATHQHARRRYEGPRA
jgi:hypothetical protein